MAQQVMSSIKQTEAASGQGETVQRMEIPEEEELQMKPMGVAIQRKEIPEEEELQMKPMGETIQQKEIPGGRRAANERR